MIPGDEYGRHAPGFACLDITKRVTDHDAVVRPSGGEVSRRLLKHSRHRLAAATLAGVMRAEINAVEMSTEGGEAALKLLVNVEQIVLREQAKSDTSLIGDNDYGSARTIQRSDGRA